jgi:hypothetical protein
MSSVIDSAISFIITSIKRKFRKRNMEKILHKKIPILPLLSICCFVLCDVRFFYFYSLPAIFAGAASNKCLLSLASMIIACLFFLNKKNWKSGLGLFGKWILVLWFFILTEAIIHKLRYQYPWTTVLWPCIPFAILTMYFPLRIWFRNKRIYLFFLRFAQICWLIMAVLLLYQNSIFQGRGTLFLKITDSIPLFNIWHVQYNMRVLSMFEGTVRIIILCSFYEILKCHKIRYTAFDTLFILVMLAAIVIIDQSRYYLITVMVSMFLMAAVRFLPYDFQKRDMTATRKKKKNTFKFIAVPFGLVIMVNLYSIAKSIFNRSGSLYARTGSIRYYLSLLKSNFLFGLGAVIPAEGEKYYTYIKGEDGIYNYDDLGLFGSFVCYGIFVLLWYISLGIKMLKLLFSQLSKNYLAWGLVCMFIISSLLQSYVDKQRIMCLLLTFVLLDVSTYKLTSKIEQSAE